MSKLKQEVIITGVSLDRRSSAPLYRQVYNEIRNAILDGRFLPGQQLPPSRELASYLQVSRTTITQAFEHLMLEGYIKGQQGSGTYISDDIPENLLYSNYSGETAANCRELSPQQQAQMQALINCIKRESRDYNLFLPFKPGLPDLTAFPFHTWAKLLSRSTGQLPPAAFGYSSSAGYKPLRRAIADYLRVARGVRCEPEQVIITSGAQQAIHMVQRVLLQKGAKIGFEDPGYPDARNIFATAEMELLSMPLDEEGLNFESAGDKPEMIYVTPSHQYPLGITMSLNRRLALLDYAKQNNIWILEDDYDSEFRYNGLPISSLQGIDNAGLVIYMGTFSKVMFPGIRLGFLVVPPNLIEGFIAARFLGDRQSSIVDQAALEQFITGGHFGRHIRKMRLLYQQRRDALYENVEAYLADHWEMTLPEAGLHTIAWLKTEPDDGTYASRLGHEGILTPPLSSYVVHQTQRPGLVLGYAAYSEEQSQQVLKTIARLTS